MTETIRHLSLDDLDIYKSIRIEALNNAPYAFASSVEEEQGDPDHFFNQRRQKAPILGFFLDEELAGIAGYVIQKGIKKRHKAFIWGVYVRPECRGKNISRKMLEEIISENPSHVVQVCLDVESNNVPARTTYESLGFEEYGVEKRALKIDDKYHDEILMVKFLK